jgi:hypothetical protein
MPIEGLKIFSAKSEPFSWLNIDFKSSSTSSCQLASKNADFLQHLAAFVWPFERLAIGRL